MKKKVTFLINNRRLLNDISVYFCVSVRLLLRSWLTSMVKANGEHAPTSQDCAFQAVTTLEPPLRQESCQV